MNATVLNPIQLHILEMFNYTKSEQGLAELNDVLTHFVKSRQASLELSEEDIMDEVSAVRYSKVDGL